MYFIPRPVKCPKCGLESQYSESLQVEVPKIDGMPVCPVCYERFLKENNVPAMVYIPNVRDQVSPLASGASSCASRNRDRSAEGMGINCIALFAPFFSWVRMPLIAILMLVILFFTAELWARYCIHADVGIVDVFSYFLQNCAKK